MKYFIKKIITLIITLLFISLLTFTAFSVIPGDAAVSKLGVDASPEAIARVRAEYELDQPVLTRYVHWLGKALHGDFGQSYKYDTMTVTQLLQSRLPVTILLAVMSFIIIIVVSLTLGMLSARYAGKWLDVVINQVVSTLCRQMAGCSDQSGDADHNGDSVFLSGNYPDGYFWSGA